MHSNIENVAVFLDTLYLAITRYSSLLLNKIVILFLCLGWAKESANLEDSKRIIVDNVKSFVADFLEGKIQHHLMSEEVPEDFD